MNQNFSRLRDVLSVVVVLFGLAACGREHDESMATEEHAMVAQAESDAAAPAAFVTQAGGGSAEAQLICSHRGSITSIAAGGAGVGRLQDGRAVFVHRTAPGDEAYVKISEEKPRFARASLLKVEKPGPGRRKAPCPHYARCGGCTLEHLEYMAQLRVKSFLVADALNRIGKLDVALPHVEPSPTEFRYRNRVSFTLMRLQHGRVVAGFHELEKPGRIVDIGGACLLPEEPIAEAWDELRANWGPDANLLPKGGKLRLTLRAAATGSISLVIEGGTSGGDPDKLLQAVPRIASLWHRPHVEEEMVLLGGQEAIQESWQDEELDRSRRPIPSCRHFRSS